MSELSPSGGFWFRPRDPLLPRARLRAAVLDLTRARRLQVLVDHGFAGLLIGLALAAAAMLAARVAQVQPWPLAGAVVAMALAAAVLAGWRRRPGALDVAIRADLKLKLKQRLSTAWEYLAAHPDGELTERLAVQAVNAGLPADPGTVFPLRVNRWGRLAPLAALALLLAAVIEIDRPQASAARAPDARGVSEGERLGAFGRAMQERAARERLPRSSRQGAELERLGTRMESGALSRNQAVGELRRMGTSLEEERRQALAEAGGADGGPRNAGKGAPPGNRGSPSGTPAGSDLNPEAMLDRMRRGGLDSADLRALTRYQQELERSGGAGDALDKALERQRAGADDALKEILENLARTERARKEARELGRAREQVLRSQESLGDAQAAARGRGARAEIDWDDDERLDRDAGSAGSERAEARRSDAPGRADPRSASQGDGVATDRAQSPYRPEPGPRGPVLQPQGEMREGEAHSSQARLPARAGRASVENVEMAREFAPQVEEVLSREHYPAHYKEFIRRYFLSLSRGTRDAPGEAVQGGEKQ
jgi:hypothetical protein